MWYQNEIKDEPLDQNQASSGSLRSAPPFTSVPNASHLQGPIEITSRSISLLKLHQGNSKSEREPVPANERANSASRMRAFPRDRAPLLLQETGENEESPENTSPIILHREFFCSHYDCCLSIAAALNWDSFSCQGCCGEVNEQLLWRAHQQARRDKVVDSLCQLPKLPKVVTEVAARSVNSSTS